MSIATVVDNAATVKAVAAHDAHRPGVRVDVGPVYLSLSTTEAVDRVDAIVGALAELEESGELRRNEDAIRAAVGVRAGP
ncbi:hypothetical protein GS483_11835 [Rhodococcus hoagii]|nr:hypothetical protein [Prescottella equi]